MMPQKILKRSDRALTPEVEFDRARKLFCDRDSANLFTFQRSLWEYCFDTVPLGLMIVGEVLSRSVGSNYNSIELLLLPLAAQHRLEARGKFLQYLTVKKITSAMRWSVDEWRPDSHLEGWRLKLGSSVFDILLLVDGKQRTFEEQQRTQLAGGGVGQRFSRVPIVS